MFEEKKSSVCVVSLGDGVFVFCMVDMLMDAGARCGTAVRVLVSALSETSN